MCLFIPERYERTLRIGSATAIILIGVAVLFLLADAGVPLRALNALAFSNNASWLTWGVRILIGAAAAAVLLAFCIFFDYESGSVRWWFICLPGILLGFALCAYTGFLLQSASRVPAWGNPFLPWLFTASALALGFSTVTTIARCFETRLRAKRAFGPTMVGLGFTAAEAIVLAAFVAWLIAAAEAGSLDGATQAEQSMAMSLRALMSWPWAVLFWIGAVGAGAIFPLVCDIRYAVVKLQPKWLANTSFACAALGNLALRFCVLMTAFHTGFALLF